MSYNIQTQKKSSDQQQERLELLKHLIQLYTHHNSSCVPRHVANDMLISITYIAHHATGDASLKKTLCSWFTTVRAFMPSLQTPLSKSPALCRMVPK